MVRPYPCKHHTRLRRDSKVYIFSQHAYMDPIWCGMARFLASKKIWVHLPVRTRRFFFFEPEA